MSIAKRDDFNSSITFKDIYTNSVYLEIVSNFSRLSFPLSQCHRDDIAWLLFFSYTLGSNKSFVQASGGNTSLKINDFILIKASGKRLSDCLQENIFLLIEKKSFDENALTLSCSKDLFGSNLRPSIETAFHCLDKRKFVVHTHPIDIIRSSLVDTYLDKHLKNIQSFSPVLVSYYQPGYELAAAIKNSTSNNGENCYILRNHGLLFGCNSGPEVLSKHLEIVDGFRIDHINNDAPTPDSTITNYVKELNSVDIAASLPDLLCLHRIAFDDVLYNFVRTTNIVPDAVVFLGNKNVFLDSYPVNILDNLRLVQHAKFVVIKNIGVIIISSTESKKSLVELFLEMHVKIFSPLIAHEEINSLTSSQVEALLNWEAEKYRLSMIK